jgi:hypothetical protein
MGFFLSRHYWGLKLLPTLDQGLRIKQNDKYDAPPGARWKYPHQEQKDMVLMNIY